MGVQFRETIVLGIAEGIQVAIYNMKCKAFSNQLGFT
jgi:hypothetical protein